MEEQIILVDERDSALRPADKLAAHRRGDLHRAFSVFITNSKGEMLLQRRAPDKRTFAGLWTNACCSHPRWGEELEASVRRRLREECGFETPLRHLFAFTYRAASKEGLIEHEYDHVFAGVHDGEVRGNPSEADAWRWVAAADLREELASRPDAFTPWFHLALPRVLENLRSAGNRASH